MCIRYVTNISPPTKPDLSENISNYEIYTTALSKLCIMVSVVIKFGK